MATVSALLLPPQIEAKISAQVGNTLKIPYLHSRAVGAGDYQGFNLKITAINSGDLISILQNPSL